MPRRLASPRRARPSRPTPTSHHRPALATSPQRTSTRPATPCPSWSRRSRSHHVDKPRPPQPRPAQPRRHPTSFPVLVTSRRVDEPSHPRPCRTTSTRPVISRRRSPLRPTPRRRSVPCPANPALIRPCHASPRRQSGPGLALPRHPAACRPASPRPAIPCRPASTPQFSPCQAIPLLLAPRRLANPILSTPRLPTASDHHHPGGQPHARYLR
jgi:hypothetical protein